MGPRLGKGGVVPYVGTWIEMTVWEIPPQRTIVVPYVGTWIEIYVRNNFQDMEEVVPYVGTWIEIPFSKQEAICITVVPYVGTWIEINSIRRATRAGACRSLRGNVDRNAVTVPSSAMSTCRSLRGNVDRNSAIRLTAVTTLLSFPTWERG